MPHTRKDAKHTKEEDIGTEEEERSGTKGGAHVNRHNTCTRNIAHTAYLPPLPPQVPVPGFWRELVTTTDYHCPLIHPHARRKG